MGSEPYLVMAGVIVDAARMHVTKDDWNELLPILSRICGRELREFHTKDVYRGNGPWRGVDGPRRANVIEAVLEWWEERKHSVTFSAIDKAAHRARSGAASALPHGCETGWRMGALHLILSVQKEHQRVAKNKGHTVLLFDHESAEEKPISELVARPPEWTDEYYKRRRRQGPLDQIVDVPFFGDSEEVLLLQVADLVAYLLRRYAELEHGTSTEAYIGEHGQVRGWVVGIVERAIPTAARWPRRNLSQLDELFRDLAPAAIRDLGG